MTIISYTPEHRQTLSQLMLRYFDELGEQIPEEILFGKLAELIQQQHIQGILQADLALEGTCFLGFSLYQIDSEKSDWCKHPGWGCIREFYVIPEFRNRGLGKALAVHTEEQLFRLGAKTLYLTADSAIPFWQKCGWTLTEERCSNGLSILTK